MWWLYVSKCICNVRSLAVWLTAQDMWIWMQEVGQLFQRKEKKMDRFISQESEFLRDSNLKWVLLIFFFNYVVKGKSQSVAFKNEPYKRKQKECVNLNLKLHKQQSDSYSILHSLQACYRLKERLVCICVNHLCLNIGLLGSVCVFDFKRTLKNKGLYS